MEIERCEKPSGPQQAERIARLESGKHRAQIFLSQMSPYQLAQHGPIVGEKRLLRPTKCMGFPALNNEGRNGGRFRGRP